MMTKAGPQCDACDKIVTAPDFPQIFYVPPGKNFGGIGTRSKPNVPAQLIACPGCWPKVKRAVVTKNFVGLPDGRLRSMFTRLVLAHGVHNFKLKEKPVEAPRFDA